MFRLIFIILISTCFLLSDVVIYAQQMQKEPLKTQKIIPEAFKQKIAIPESKLKNIDGILSRIESQRLVRDGDGEAMEKEMYEYAEQMRLIFDESLRNAEEAAKSQGKSGNVESLNSFETTAKLHETKIRKIEARIKTIESQIKTGVIKLDRPILQKMSPSERDEFHKFLTPEGQRQMQKMHPDLFRPGMKSGASVDIYKVSSSTSERYCRSSIYAQFSNFFIGQAEASIAVNCIGVCIAKKWSDCLNCVKSVGPAAVNAWNDFKRCWDDCCGCKWYKPWCCACKAGCLLKFIAKLG